ncbi:hypothetical protein O0L34_g305 [Tuta absoluta]|nr:hypothetical protein O0L34_g305 [Tuta absoluta]
MSEWIVSCKKALRLCLRRIYVSKKTYHERSSSRPLQENTLSDRRRYCLTNLCLVIIFMAFCLVLMPPSAKVSRYSEKSIESKVIVNPKQIMKVNIPKDMKVDLARKWLSRNAPKIEREETSTVTFKSLIEQAKDTIGYVIITDDNQTLSTTIIPIVTPVCDTRVSPEKLTLTTSVIKVSLDSIYPMVQNGGHYKPTGCIPVHTVAIIVPYRNRTRNLTTFLYNIHPFLMTQNLEYRIFVIEQFGNNKFNKGRLFNAGFKEVKKYGSWRCVVFHDVDLLPMDRRIFYTCPQYPRHMSSSIIDRPSRRNSSSPILFGGVTAMTLEHYEKANGHSNMYWGWGGEDYDMFWRIRVAQIPIVRYNQTIARFLALSHPLAPENPSRYALIKSAIDRWQTEGLNTIDYKVILVEQRHLFTHITVDIAPLGEDRKVHDKIKDKDNIKAKKIRTKKDIVKHRNREDIATWGEDGKAHDTLTAIKGTKEKKKDILKHRNRDDIATWGEDRKAHDTLTAIKGTKEKKRDIVKHSYMEDIASWAEDRKVQDMMRANAEKKKDIVKHSYMEDIASWAEDRKVQDMMRANAEKKKDIVKHSYMEDIASWAEDRKVQDMMRANAEKKKETVKHSYMEDIASWAEDRKVQDVMRANAGKKKETVKHRRRDSSGISLNQIPVSQEQYSAFLKTKRAPQFNPFHLPSETHPPIFAIWG